MWFNGDCLAKTSAHLFTIFDPLAVLVGDVFAALWVGGLQKMIKLGRD